MTEPPINRVSSIRQCIAICSCPLGQITKTTPEVRSDDAPFNTLVSRTGSRFAAQVVTSSICLESPKQMFLTALCSIVTCSNDRGPPDPVAAWADDLQPHRVRFDIAAVGVVRGLVRDHADHSMGSGRSSRSRPWPRFGRPGGSSGWSCRSGTACSKSWPDGRAVSRSRLGKSCYPDSSTTCSDIGSGRPKCFCGRLPGRSNRSVGSAASRRRTTSLGSSVNGSGWPPGTTEWPKRSRCCTCTPVR